MNSPVLHALRCVGSTGLARVASFTGLTESDVESDLIDLAVTGHVTHVFGGWSLTEAGRAAATAATEGELEPAGTRPALAAAFDEFLVLNPELLDLCTAWQMRSADGVTTVNDHSDTAYDARVLALFADLHERAVVVIAALAAAVPRFGRYEPRLTTALTRAQAGELACLADSVDSFHTIWAELHEDLLATLGIARWGG
ncbi:transcriptional regulator [Lentzea sp. HUAS12]|uniref:transcriptional regulator n=1 Tax=Lentzea sp. HUAS12 TaxID=2951806 RepID=UPI00209E8590|nr:transcriptional regulator [Lentzea sp. HUAS12]USX54855.1 transcriptional regulator [Lentzea sp. HUAS12]